MGRGVSESALRRAADVIDAGAQALPLHGRLPLEVLQSLAVLIPADCVTFGDLEPATATHHAVDELAGGEIDFLAEPETEPDHGFWRHYDHSVFCSYPTRTGDDRSVTSRSDFYSTREWKQTPMFLEVMPEFVFELMCPLPAPAGRSRRVLFLRSGSYDFTDDDRFALALLRPHLSEMVARRSHQVGHAGLTQRQSELMRLVADGRTNAEIATQLHLSPHTVRTHLTNIFERLGVTTRTAAVARLYAT
jgi:DNA-binding CsgD family transcriptional regulator